jgi:hypothetical protein
MEVSVEVRQLQVKNTTKSKLSETQIAKLRAIRPTCASCGLPAKVDCHNACAYIFGRVAVTTALPPEVAFNEDQQFSLSVPVCEDGRNFGKQRAKMCWFGSARCAELFLMLHGHCKGTDRKTPIGNGERLLMFLGGADVVKTRKKRVRASTLAKSLLAAKYNGQTAISGQSSPFETNDLV